MNDGENNKLDFRSQMKEFLFHVSVVLAAKVAALRRLFVRPRFELAGFSAIDTDLKDVRLRTGDGVRVEAEKDDRN